MAFPRSLVCAWHTKIPKLFIFLTLPYGAVTCLSLSTLTEEVQDPGGCVQGRPPLNNVWFLLLLLLGGLC